MYLTIVVLTCCFAAQPPVDEPLVPIHSPHPRRSPADVVAKALELPDEAGLAGRPLALVDALSRAASRREQLEVTHAYWDLAEAVAEYRIAWEHAEALRRIQAAPEELALLETARAAASAALGVARASALSAQHDLAQAAMLPPGDAPPLPLDPPHVDTYRTYYDEVFSKQNPPAWTRLVDRNLPVRRRLIEARLAAVEAERDALEAVAEAYGARSVELGAVLSAARRLAEAKRTLWSAVAGYNHDIADYALSVAGPQSDRRVLVSMLIRTNRPTDAPARGSGASTRAPPPGEGQHTVASPSAVRQAGLNEPVPAWEQGVSPGRLRPSGRRTPTLAPPPPEDDFSDTADEPEGANEPGSVAEPSVADEPERETEAEEGVEGVEGQAEKSEGWENVGPSVNEETATAQETGEPERPDAPPPEASADGPGRGEAAARPSQSTVRTVKRPTDPQATPPSTTSLYPSLVDAKPAVQAKLLGEQLHWRETAADAEVEPVELASCLGNLYGEARRRAISAYWRAARRGAEYQALDYQLSQLEALVPGAFDRRDGPFGAEAMLQLQAARLAAEAELLRAELRLRQARFELTESVGRPLDGPWLSPATMPHAGPYLLKLDAQPRRVAQSWPVRRLAAVIPALCEGFQHRASAVVQADAARAQAAEAYESGDRPVTAVIEAIQYQTDQTLGFLDTLAEYNQAIADYVLAVLPPTVPSQQLAGALVLAR